MAGEPRQGARRLEQNENPHRDRLAGVSRRGGGQGVRVGPRLRGSGPEGRQDTVQRPLQRQVLAEGRVSGAVRRAPDREERAEQVERGRERRRGNRPAEPADQLHCGFRHKRKPDIGGRGRVAPPRACAKGFSQ